MSLGTARCSTRMESPNPWVPMGSELGVDGLERYVAASADRSLEEFAEAIRQRVEQFRGGVRPDDDELLLAIAYLEAEG